MTVDEEVLERIKRHYKNSKQPLMLSSLGKELRDERIWPVAGETRSLRQIIESLSPNAGILADPTSPSFLVAVSKGHEKIAKEAIESRADTRYLEKLPRSVVIAFVTGTSEDSIYLQPSTPFRYSVNNKPSNEFVEIENKYRVPGSYFDSIKDIPADNIKAIADNIRGWLDDHQIPSDSLSKPPPSGVSVPTSSSDLPSHPVDGRLGQISRTALDRLLAAQSPDVARLINVPLDIAQTLSRIP